MTPPSITVDDLVAAGYREFPVPRIYPNATALYQRWFYSAVPRRKLFAVTWLRYGESWEPCCSMGRYARPRRVYVQMTLVPPIGIDAAELFFMDAFGALDFDAEEP